LKMSTHAHFYWRAIETRVGLCMQDYKSLCAAVTICASLVNIQTDIHTQTISLRMAQPAEVKINENRKLSGRIKNLANSLHSVKTLRR